MVKFSSYDERIFFAFCIVADESKYHSEITLVKVADKLGTSKQSLSQTHYKNINEIINALHIYIDQEIYRKLQNYVNNNGTKEIVPFFAAEILPLLYGKRDYLRVLFGGVADPSWHNYIDNQYTKILRPHLSKTEKLINVDSEFITRYVIRHVMSITASWLADPCPESPITFSKKFIHLMTQTSALLGDGYMDD